MTTAASSTGYHTTLINEVWRPMLNETYFLNDWMFGAAGSLFGVEDAVGGGSTVSDAYEYSITSNAAIMGNVFDPMPNPYTASQVRAYWNKDYAQEAARVSEIHVAQLGGGGSQVAMNVIQKSLDTAARNLRDVLSVQMISDMAADVDSASAYSDASLTRATYDLASYEATSVGSLALADLEDAIEALENPAASGAYGPGVRSRSDLVICMPRNQLTNLSRLVTGASNLNFDASTQDNTPIDAGRVFRTVKFEGIDLVVVPDMTTTEILILHKPDVKVYRHLDLRIIPKQEAAFTQLWHLVAGYSCHVSNTKNSAKLSGITA